MKSKITFLAKLILSLFVALFVSGLSITPILYLMPHSYAPGLSPKNIFEIRIFQTLIIFVGFGLLVICAWAVGRRVRFFRITAWIITGFWVMGTLMSLLNVSGTPSGQTYHCTRTEKYQNLPEFDRALSLIDQRMSKSQIKIGHVSDRVIGTEMARKDGKIISYELEGDIWHKIIPCVRVQYSDVKNQLDNAEGYFSFDTKVANQDVLPVYVDRSYNEADDLLLSVLLVHEIQHANQFISELNGEHTSCYDKETDAFTTQWRYFTYLNKEEQYSIVGRMINFPDHPQLQILSQMYQIYLSSGRNCGNDTGCSFNMVSSTIDGFVKNSLYYQKQCSKR